MKIDSSVGQFQKKKKLSIYLEKTGRFSTEAILQIATAKTTFSLQNIPTENNDPWKNVEWLKSVKLMHSQ